MTSAAYTRRSVSGSRASRSTAQSQQHLSLAEQFKKIFRHPAILALCVLLGALLGGLASILQTPTYVSTAKVVVNPLVADPNAEATTQMKVEIDTEASVAGSYQVSEAAAQKIDPSDPDLANSINQNLEVIPHSGASILDFKASADSAEKAADYANESANAYLTVRQDALKKQVDSNVQGIQAQIDAIEGESAAKTALQEKLGQVKSTSTAPGRVITEGNVPSAASGLDTWKMVLVGTVAGALIGAVIAAIVDSKSRKVKYFDRANDVAGQDVYPIRGSHEVEDTRRFVLSLGEASNTPGSTARLPNAVIYSPTPGAASKFTEIFASAQDDSNIHFTDSLRVKPGSGAILEAAQQTIIATPQDSEVSDVLRAAKSFGLCIVAVTAETSVHELREFAHAAESVRVNTEYVFLDN